MKEAKISDAVITISLAQITVLILKLCAIGSAAKMSWISVFLPTWLPVLLVAVIVAFYVLSRILFPEKKKHVKYTSNRWQERLTEIHSNR